MKILLVLLLFSLSIATVKAQPFKYVADGPTEVDKYYDLDTASVMNLKKGDTILLTGWYFPYWKVKIGNFTGFIHQLWINNTPEMKRYTRHLDSLRFGNYRSVPDTAAKLIYPEYINGPDAWRQYLSDNLKIPEELKSGEFVKVSVKFVVEKDGSITHINMPDRLDDNYTKEAIRLLKKSPKWKPGLRNGYPAPYDFSVYIVFYHGD